MISVVRVHSNAGGVIRKMTGCLNRRLLSLLTRSVAIPGECSRAEPIDHCWQPLCHSAVVTCGLSQITSTPLPFQYSNNACFFPRYLQATKNNLKMSALVTGEPLINCVIVLRSIPRTSTNCEDNARNNQSRGWLASFGHVKHIGYNITSHGENSS